MGKGDRKTKKGKIIKGTFGVRRPKKRKANVAIPAKKRQLNPSPIPKKLQQRQKKLQQKKRLKQKINQHELI